MVQKKTTNRKSRSKDEIEEIPEDEIEEIPEDENKNREKREKPVRKKLPSNFLLTKLVRGELGLANTYWLCGGLLGIATLSLSWSPDILSNSLEDPTAAVIFYGLIILIFNILTAIGVWRSANKYKGNKTWGILAIISTLISAIWIIVSIIITVAHSIDYYSY